MTNSYRRWLAFALPLLGACGKGSMELPETKIEPPPRAATLSLEVPALSDTIGVVAANPIVIRVHRGTTPVAAAEIRVTVSTPAGALPLAAVGTASAGPFTQSLTNQTSASGELRVFVSLANAVGQGMILVEAPSLSLRDSTPFTVRPGRLAKWTIVSRDTAVFVSNTLKINQELFDRAGNPSLAELPQVIATSGVSATSTNGVFQADPTIQRGRIILRTSLRTDTVQVSVVPRDTVVFAWYSGHSVRLVAVGLDGRIARTFGDLLPPGRYDPALSPDGLRLVSSEGQGYGGSAASRLYIADTTGPRRDLAGSVKLPTARYRGTFFRSADWILFQSRTPQDSTSVWRVRSDGSGEVQQLMTRDLSEFIFDAYPFPDGRSVVVAKNLPDGSNWFFRLDLITRQLSVISRASALASIAVSPTGDRIAWTGLSYELFVVNADGTGRQVLASNVGVYRPVWTRDGRYLVVASGTDASGSAVVDAVTGAVISLPWNRKIGEAIAFQEPGGRP